MRGNAWQVYEKYLQLARDASGSGDRVAAENYQQHAEHYYRIIEAINEASGGDARPQPVQQQPQPAMQPPRNGGGNQPSFATQPEIPANYYTAETLPSPNAAPQAVNDQGQPVQAQAEVQLRNPPPAPNTLFPPEDTDDQGGLASLVARR